MIDIVVFLVVFVGIVCVVVVVGVGIGVIGVSIIWIIGIVSLGGGRR